jgi:hypothetical protein
MAPVRWSIRISICWDNGLLRAVETIIQRKILQGQDLLFWPKQGRWRQQNASRWRRWGGPFRASSRYQSGTKKDRDARFSLRSKINCTKSQQKRGCKPCARLATP